MVPSLWSGGAKEEFLIHSIKKENIPFGQLSELILSFWERNHFQQF